MDKDFEGDIIFRRGTQVVATAQEHHEMGDTTVLQYILAGLPEYSGVLVTHYRNIPGKWVIHIHDF